MFYNAVVIISEKRLEMNKSNRKEEKKKKTLLPLKFKFFKCSAMNLSFEYNWLAAIVLYPISGKKPTSLNLEPLPLPNVYDGPVRKSNFF